MNDEPDAQRAASYWQQNGDAFIAVCALRWMGAPAATLAGDLWRALFLEFPDRFMVGTDTYAPSAGARSGVKQPGQGCGSPICP